MLPPHFQPPYQVVLNNPEDATVMAGERLIARFNGGWDVPYGHANACFFAKASGSYDTLVSAVRAARDYLSGNSQSAREFAKLKAQLELTLRQAAEEPPITHWSTLECRRTDLRKLLAPFLDRPAAEMPPISEEQDKLLGELEKIEFLLGLR